MRGYLGNQGRNRPNKRGGRGGPDGNRGPRQDELVEALRSAGFDVVRLILAFLVLVSHTWPLGGFGEEPPSPLTPPRT